MCSNLQYTTTSRYLHMYLTSRPVLQSSLTASGYHHSTSLYLTLLLYLSSTRLYYIHSTMDVLDSTSFYRCSTSLHLTLPHSTMALLGSTWLYLALLDVTSLYHHSTWLYLTQLHPTTALLGSPSLFVAQLHSTVHLLGSQSHGIVQESQVEVRRVIVGCRRCSPTTTAMINVLSATTWCCCCDEQSVVNLP